VGPPLVGIAKSPKRFVTGRVNDNPTRGTNGPDNAVGFSISANMIAVVEFRRIIFGENLTQGFFLLPCHSVMATYEADFQSSLASVLADTPGKSVPSECRLPFCRVKGFDPRSLGRGTPIQYHSGQ
jgi:hypothetical protein